jgi:peroxiredoxin
LIQLSMLYSTKPLLLTVYLGTDCPMCVMNLRNLSQRVERIHAYGWDVAALSNDAPEENQAAVKRSRINDDSFAHGGSAFAVPLYSDTDHHAMERLGCYRRAVDTERHGIFLIDTRGMVRFAAVDRRPFEQYDVLMDSLRAITSITAIRR